MYIERDNILSLPEGTLISIKFYSKDHRPQPARQYHVIGKAGVHRTLPLRSVRGACAVLQLVGIYGIELNDSRGRRIGKRCQVETVEQKS